MGQIFFVDRKNCLYHSRGKNLIMCEHLSIFFFQIIRERLPNETFRDATVWNSLPGALVTLPSFSDSPENFPFQVDYNNDEGFTAIIYCQLGLSLTPSAPLYRLVTNVARSKYVSKVSSHVLRLTHFNH